MYTKSRLGDQEGREREILTFGPLSVLPEFQRRGIGKALLEESFVRAAALGYGAVVIFGNPGNYVFRGFKSCKRYHVCLEDQVYPCAMLVKELREGFFDGRVWRYRESPAYDIDEKAAEDFDRGFEPKEKQIRPSQEEFYIYSNSVIREAEAE